MKYMLRTFTGISYSWGSRMYQTH